VYSAAPIERTDAEAHEDLFLFVVRQLLDAAPSFTADTHSAVWVNVFDQPDHNRLVATFLNYQAELPPAPVPVNFTLTPPSGRRFTTLSLAPEGGPIPFALRADGALEAELDRVEWLSLAVATYE
jgi:hypothetical protein